MSVTTGGDNPDISKGPRIKPHIHFIAGGVGGTLGAIITCPLEVVKTRLQSSIYRERASSSIRSILTYTQQHASSSLLLLTIFTHNSDIYRTEGLQGLWRGIGPNLVGVIPSRAVYFSTYASIKSYLLHDLRIEESPMVHLAAAATAGVATSTMTNPIWLIKTRMQLQSSVAQPSAADSLKSSPQSTATKTVVTAASKRSIDLSFIPRHQLQRHNQQPLTIQRSALHTPPAAAAATTTTATAAAMPQYRNSIDCLVQVIKQEGVKGLFRGLGASYIGTIEGTMQWIVYEQLKKSLAEHRQLSVASSGPSSAGKQESSSSSSPWQRFTGIQTSQIVDGLVVAGTAKFLASITTYPHEVLRTRLRQVVVTECKRTGEKLVTPKYSGIGCVLRQVLREEGFLAFYGGLTAHLLRTVPNAAIMFFCYETVVKVFH